MDKYYTVEQVAELLRIAPKTIPDLHDAKGNCGPVRSGRAGVCQDYDSTVYLRKILV